jgi:hypothetical protein
MSSFPGDELTTKLVFGKSEDGEIAQSPDSIEGDGHACENNSDDADGPYYICLEVESKH